MNLTLADLMREVLKGERLYTMQGDEWCGWWVGHIPGDRQLFAALGGRSVYYPRWQRLMHPDLADPNAGSPTVYLALFDKAGRLQEVRTRPDPLQINPKAEADNGAGPEFDVAELEGWLRAEFDGFERAPIRVRPFSIPEIGLRLNPLISAALDILDNPEACAEDEEVAIRAWIEEGCGELSYGNDYFLDGEGEVSSS
jgi:hypothetical protein